MSAKWEAVLLWRRLIPGDARDFKGLDFSKSVDVILVTFGALVAISLTDFFDEKKNKAFTDDVRFWAILALLALLLRFIVGSAVHLNRTYNRTPQNPADYANSPSILLFLKDIGFLIAFGIVAILITHSATFLHFLQKSATFVALSLAWSLLDAVIHWFGYASDEPPFYVIWVPIDAAQLLLIFCVYPLQHDPLLGAIALAVICISFTLVDLFLTIRVNALRHP